MAFWTGSRISLSSTILAITLMLAKTAYACNDDQDCILQVRQCESLLQSTNPNYGIACYERMSRDGIGIAAFNLGALYSDGTIVPIDQKQSEYYFLIAANLEFEGAAFNLGNVICQNNFFDRKAECVHWMQVAGENGDPAGYHNLALYLANFDVDIEGAVANFQLAAKMGFEPSIEVLESLGIAY